MTLSVLTELFLSKQVYANISLGDEATLCFEFHPA